MLFHRRREVHGLDRQMRNSSYKLVAAWDGSHLKVFGDKTESIFSACFVKVLVS